MKHPQSKPTALVVDDEDINRLVLAALLKQNGFLVVEAANGVEAVDRFETLAPDIVFMDVMMPRMDGYEATRRIKALCGRHFVPVIVLTAMADEESLARCLEVGGDDVLTKPFDELILTSKINAMMRIRGLHEEVTRLYDRSRRDEEIAEEVFSGVVMAGNVALNKLPHILKPAGTFSGDVLLTAYGPGRDLHVLLGDFTGHGLAAALGAVPTAQIFRDMVAKGHTGDEILARINTQLHQLLPSGMFLTAGYVQLSSNLRYARVFNFAMPEIYHIAGSTREIKRRIDSQFAPLGIDSLIPIAQIGETVKLDWGDSLVIFSDGVWEARGAEGDDFGSDRIVDAITRRDIGMSAADAVAQQLQAFCSGVEQRDDISLVEIPCKPEILPIWDSIVSNRDPKELGDLLVDSKTSATHDAVELQVTVHGARLAKADPVPLLLGNIRELVGEQVDYQVLYTILTELYANAVDHGVLGLSSVDKESEDGFINYLNQRQEKLAALISGYVSIRLLVKAFLSGVRVTVSVEDSGPGFDCASDATARSTPEHSGRGIALISALCESLRYEPPGNKVEAVFYSKFSPAE